ncbi:MULTISPECIES: carboxymuconolactone decarboxylase family protein [unclassified Sporosarcina]|uniref:carboxymuconolactone decarboxylase family protein n=1 Tax=unclassified Sporosarcina TaxID=2647733 RepID=UPI00203C50C7|nr:MULTISPECIES: carboxymuconolactone decarboxylase family protein [unclassified Sporosarcina]GKV65882.1 hypothetical protein NCCP2331_20350 [Sporosarcina sp. NCCP-2331]GLB56007.1 hypothetical protein NCCP2378_17940 [Sporosarcina sp. NCCP-2378]
MTEGSLYKKSNMKRLPELAKLSPKAFKAFVEFDQEALSAGLITKKTKELMAIAIAHVTGCPYCIDAHVTAAKKESASKEELAEVIMVATALKAGSAMAHGLNALQAFDENGNENLYQVSHMSRFPEFMKLSPDAFKAFQVFDKEAMKEGLISRKDKELIAVAIAHVTGCPYCIEAHVKQAKRLDCSKEEIAEAIMVATALKAGAALSHGVNALNSYD